MTKIGDGGQISLPNLRPLDGVTVTDERPNAVTVNVSSQNFHITPTPWAAPTKPTTTFKPDAVKHGGIPTDHNVR